MLKLFTDIREFHVKFGLEQTEMNADLHPEEWALRHRRLFDEYSEFLTAVANKDAEEQFDAIIDLAYIALGTLYRKGWPFEAVVSLGIEEVLQNIGTLSQIMSVAAASAADDTSQHFAALVQTVQTCVGLAGEMGWDFQAGWDRVHAANMAKERGKPNNSKYGSGFDIIKPQGWTAPDLSDLV